MRMLPFLVEPQLNGGTRTRIGIIVADNSANSIHMAS